MPLEKLTTERASTLVASHREGTRITTREFATSVPLRIGQSWNSTRKLLVHAVNHIQVKCRQALIRGFPTLMSPGIKVHTEWCAKSSQTSKCRRALIRGCPTLMSPGIKVASSDAGVRCQTPTREMHDGGTPPWRPHLSRKTPCPEH